jgi:hypothetical protein
MAGKHINRVMVQESRFKGEVRRFEIYNDKFIKINIQNVFGDKAYHLNMGMLEPWPSLHRRISWRWLLGLSYFSLATVIYVIYLYQHSSNETLGQLIPFITLFLVLALAALLMFLYQSPNVMEFRSRYGNCVLIRLLKNQPSKQEFRHFTDELKTRVLAASQVVTFNKKQMLAIELNELRRLTDEGVLLEDEYQQAKDRVMNMHL